MSDLVWLYNCRWSKFENPASVEAVMIRRGGGWKKRDGSMAGNGLKFHFKRFISLVWPDHVWHRWNEIEVDAYLNYRIIGELGPASCVREDTRIFNPRTGESPTIGELYQRKERPIVATLRGPVQASVPFVKGWDRIYRVILRSGNSFRATAGHLVLTPHGFRTVSSLCANSAIVSLRDWQLNAYRQESTSAHGRSIHASSGQRSSQKAGGFQYDCQPCSCSSDGQPPAISVAGQDAFPSPVDAQARIAFPASEHLGDPGHRPTRNRLDQQFSRLSTDCIHGPCVSKETAPQPLAHSTIFGHGDDWCQWLPKSPLNSPWRQPFSESFPDCSEDCTSPSVFHWLTSWKSKVQLDVVTSIESCGSDFFFDLQVPDAHHYFAEGAIHHNSGKTHSAAIHSLADFYVWNDCTTVLVSSTTLEMLQMRVWGEIKKLHRQAKEKFPLLIPGNLIESRYRIVTDNKWDTDGRDFRNGIMCIPLKLGGAYQGLGSMVGVKNKRVRLIADELSLCPPVFVDAIANLNKNPDFKCLGLGNPKETTDALGRLCEPAANLGGWDGGIDQGPKTKTWPTRFEKGICVQLVGSDSPNLNGQMGIPLIEQKAIDVDIAFYGKDSLQFTMMNEGRMPRGQGLRRVITRQMCLKYGAMEEAIWKDDNRTKIAFCDAAYGSVGGDRCIFGELHFGIDPNDKQILALVETMLVPVSVEVDETPEDQIASFIKRQCEQRDIPPQNFGFDSTGRGSLMAAFARIWSPYVAAIEFGGKPSERPVTWIPLANKVLCCDYYSKFVSELWYSVRLAIESRQFRGMTEDVMMEGCMREWGLVSGNRVEVEPKEKMKLKTGRSPDLFDGLVTGVEMARRHGFQISMIIAQEATKKDDAWKAVYRERMEALQRRYSLDYAT